MQIYLLKRDTEKVDTYCFLDGLYGNKKKISFGLYPYERNTFMKCPVCKGVGEITVNIDERLPIHFDCGYCKGKGHVSLYRWLWYYTQEHVPWVYLVNLLYKDCPVCNGTGGNFTDDFGWEDCPYCEGESYIIFWRRLLYKIGKKGKL
jgi:RecJ-like exonuclease